MRFSKKTLYLLFVFILVPVYIVGCAQSAKVKVPAKIDLSEYKNSDIFITPQELKGKLGTKDLIIIDANQPDAYASEHLPGAINVTWSDLSYTKGKPGDKDWGVSLNKKDLTKKLESYGVDNKKIIAVYSDVLNGPGPDGRIVWQLRMAGLDNAKLLYGGMALWKKYGFELTSAPGKVEASKGLVLKDFDQSYNATTKYVAQNLGKTKIIDVRTQKEFEGDTSHGEARGGHIKGAVWLEWKDLLNDDGTPKPAKEIIAIMKDKAGVTPKDDFAVY